MRPLDALTRHASSWGRLVTISVFAVLTAALVMAVWWAATSEKRTGTYDVRGTVNGITLDLGDADADIVGGGTAARSRSAHRPLLLRPPRPGPARRARRRRCACARAARRADRHLLGELPPARPRQRARHRPDHERRRARSSAYRGSASIETTTGDILRRLLRLPPAGPRGDRRRAGERVVLARAPRAALAPGGVHARRAAGPLPRRRRHRRRPPQRPRADAGRGRAVPDPGAVDERRRDVESGP